MTSSPDGSVPRRRCSTRRTVLRTGLAALGLAGASATVTAQEDGALQDAVIPEQQEIDQEVTGFWIHIGETVEPQEAAISDRCDFVDWSDEETLAYDAQLIDRTAEPQQSPITLYLHEDVDIAPGTLFIINSREQCESGYLGVRLERVGMDLREVRAAEPASPTGDDGEGGGAQAEGAAETDASGPGFGALGALAGLAGAGWLLRGKAED